MKKRFFLLLSIILIFTILSNTAMAEEKATIVGDKIECQSGEIVRYSVSIKDNPGIAGFLISVAAQDDWLYFDEKVEQGDFSDAGSITTSYEPQRINTLWFNADNVNGDGTLFSFDVHISPSAPSGDYPIIISVSEKNTINDEYQMVSIEAVDGCITVEPGDKASEERSEATEHNANEHEPDDNNIRRIIMASAVAVIVILLVLYFKKKK